MKCFIAVPLLCASMLAAPVVLAQPAPPPPVPDVSTVPQMPTTGAVVPVPPRPSAEMEVLGKDYMDMLGQNMTMKIQLNMAQRRWDDLCKAHADLVECKAK